MHNGARSDVLQNRVVVVMMMMMMAMAMAVVVVVVVVVVMVMVMVMMTTAVVAMPTNGGLKTGRKIEHE